MQPITREMLTLPAGAYVETRYPVSGGVEFVNAVLRITKTNFKDWRFVVQENTQMTGDGYFSALFVPAPSSEAYGWESGFQVKFDLASGSFYVDAKQFFETDAEGFAFWWRHGYSKSPKWGKGQVQEVNPELIKKGKPFPRKGCNLSAPAKRSLRELVELSNR